MKIEGQCHCGNIRFEAEVNPDQVRVCHCTDCQNSTGSAYRVNVPAIKGTFRMTGGPVKQYVKTTAESETKRVQGFCPECGTPIYSSPDHGTETVGLRVGAIRQRALLVPKVQQWMRSAQGWTQDLSGLEKVEKQQAR